MDGRAKRCCCFVLLEKGVKCALYECGAMEHETVSLYPW